MLLTIPSPATVSAPTIANPTTSTRRPPAWFRPLAESVRHEYISPVDGGLARPLIVARGIDGAWTVNDCPLGRSLTPPELQLLLGTARAALALAASLNAQEGRA